MNDICPHCGQRMLVRLGVQLSPKLADLFDAIKGQGERGIYTETLRWLLYPNHGYREGNQAIASNIYLINCRLEETDFQIRAKGRHNSDGGLAYRLVRRAVAEVA